MYFVIKDSCGEIHESDHLTREQMLEEVCGDEHSLIEQLREIVGLTKMVGSERLNNISATINGQQRVFNPRHIVWIEIHDIEEFGDLS